MKLHLIFAHFGLLLLLSCEYKPYSKSDVFLDQSSIELDDPLHSKNSLEWWYLTGHLKDKNSEDVYGVEFVFFHLTPNGSKDYTLMNFAITDPNEKQFYYDYDFHRWRQRLHPQNPIQISTPNKGFENSFEGFAGKYAVSAAMKNHDIQLQIATTPTKALLMHEGGKGYVNYGEVATAGYFSYPRLQTEGKLLINGKEIAVSGEMWYDRQWNCLGVWNKKLAWDWMSIQLDGPREEIMVYQVHLNTESDEIVRGGTFYDSLSQNIVLTDTDFSLEPLQFWESEDSKILYPISWRLRIPEKSIDLQVTAVLDDQELFLRFGVVSMYYYEGMCMVKGTYNGHDVSGKAYLEMNNRKSVEMQKQ